MRSGKQIRHRQVHWSLYCWEELNVFLVVHQRLVMRLLGGHGIGIFTGS